MEASNSPQRFSATMAKHQEFMQRVQAIHEEFMQWMKDEHQQLMQSIRSVENPNSIINNDGHSQVQDGDSCGNSRVDEENYSAEKAKSDGGEKDRTIEVGGEIANSSGLFTIPTSSLGVASMSQSAVSSMSVTGSASSPVCRKSTIGQKTSLRRFGSVSPTQSIPFGQAGSVIGCQPFGSGSQTVFGATSTSAFDSSTTSAFGEKVAATYGAFSTQYVQTKAALGIQPFGTSSQPAFEATNIFTFGSSPAVSGIVAPTYSAPSSQSVPLGQTRPVLGSQPFGTGSQHALDASNISTFGSRPAFGSSPVVGEIVAPTYGAASSHSVPLGQARPVLGSQPFDTGSQSAFDAANISTSGSMPMFCSSPVFGTAIAPTYGDPSCQLVPLAQTRPVLGSQSFGTGNQTSFGGTRTSAFSSTPAFGEIVAPTFGSTTTSAFGENVSHTYGASSTQSVPFCQTGHFLGSQPFGAGSQLAIGQTIIPTFGSTPAFVSLPVFGMTVAPTYSAPSSQSVPLGQTRPVLGSQPFDTGNQPAFGGTSTSAFGSVPAFGENGAPTLGCPSTQSVPFGQAGPILGRQPVGTGSQSSFGAMITPEFVSTSRPTFGKQCFCGLCSICWSQSVPIRSGQTALAQQEGIRVTSYRSTPICEGNLETGKIMSISGMPEYKSKSHEELRLEDFQLGNKQNQPFGAGIQPAFGATRTSTCGSTSMSAFGKTFAPTYGVPSTQPVAFGTTGTFGKIVTPTYGAPNTESVPSCQTVPVAGNQFFGAGSQPPFAATSTSTFGSTSMPVFGDMVAWMYGAPCIPALMAPRLCSYAFGITPDFGSSSTGVFGKNSVLRNNGFPFGSQSSTFGDQWLSKCYGQTASVQCGGTRIISYKSTPDCEVMNLPGEIMSLSGMPEYKNKSHEELRLKDYQLGDKGGPNFSSQQNGNPFTSSFSVSGSNTLSANTPPWCAQMVCDSSLRPMNACFWPVIIFSQGWQQPFPQ